MRKLFLLLVTFTMLLGCSKDDCTQEAFVTKLKTRTSSLSKTVTLVTICHDGHTIQVDDSSLQHHLDHGDTKGECNTLSDDKLVFGDGEVVEIGCKYNLPFIYFDILTGTTYLYEKVE